MKNFTFRQYRSSPKEDSNPSGGEVQDKDNAAYLKRREQVRRAQRTHRERKENYIKSLENELLQLRTNEARILQETRGLYSELARLKRLLDMHGIKYGNSSEITPNNQPANLPSPPGASSIGILVNPHHHHQQLHMSNPQRPAGENFWLSESDGSTSAKSTPNKDLKKKRSFWRGKSRTENILQDDQDFGQSTPTTRDASSIIASTSKLNIKDVDHTSIGMEFVLSLEAPCLHHTQGSPKDPYQPTGHALTTTAPLLFQAPGQPIDTKSSTNTRWEVPNLGLENLLSLSTHFDLTDEITPVQAWHYIRSHPDFENINVSGLRKLTEDMLKHVKCHGFGAVVETDIFGNLLRGLFPKAAFDFGF
ncbi:hypothetical protein BS50DRAFT_590771 [Corynespora cassiicola Philippines]|uniref:BZIP domain-containing protein n=1 Tax=Corynespora cassiicola Philippines TaxID=1448308 RepID=A0A2T2NET1_CORCC|nr:hypothetical protein BS50DRAFT_590771 [Corynespora cassiicola Philippines]